MKKGSDMNQNKKKNKDNKSSAAYFPKMIVLGNKKDLQKQKAAGSLKKDDVDKCEGTKIKEVSALTNEGL